jgi:hypothetical protein
MARSLFYINIAIKLTEILTSYLLHILHFHMQEIHHSKVLYQKTYILNLLNGSQSFLTHLFLIHQELSIKKSLSYLFFQLLNVRLPNLNKTNIAKSITQLNSEKPLSSTARALIVVEFIAGILVILGVGLLSVWITLTRCLKRR